MHLKPSLEGSIGAWAQNVEQRSAEERNRLLQRALERRESEVQRLNAVLATIEQGVIMQDDEGRLVLMNEAARNLLGGVKAFWESELGMLFNQFREVTSVSDEIIPLSEPTRVQINNRIIGAQLAAVADEKGARLGTLIVLRDVTNEAVSDRLKEQFVMAISHELRTPMAVIKGVSEVILEQGEETKPNRRLLETLSRNVDILDRMIVELLDISELDASNFTVRADPLDLEDLLWATVNSMQPEIKQAGLDISVMVRDQNALRIRGDMQRLRWAVGHLLQNAIRYTEEGGHLVLTANRANDTITLQVVDTGVGISERDMPHIFERFYRGEARTANGKLIDPRGWGRGYSSPKK
ncbi:MAG: multi-sensor signal transduction histidine kinase [Chloroflexi bacterium OLB15]|nr:MAG: multi-sensor signal transduction histidine kinase [Chloroflexi bacterium OLB15]